MTDSPLLCWTSTSSSRRSLDHLVELCQKSLTMHHPRARTPRECPTCNEHVCCSQCKKLATASSKRRKDIPQLDDCQACSKRLKTAKSDISNLKKEINEANKALEALRTKSDFLSSFDPKPSEGKFKGDVSFLVNSDIGDSDDHVLHAHRFVLAGKSAVFRSMFDAGMLEQQTREIKINDASFAVMQAVVNFCYTAEITFSDLVQAEDVLKVAHKYDIGPLRALCDAELCKKIDARTLPDLLKLARRFDAKRLQDEAVKYFKEHFDAVQNNILESFLAERP